MADYEGIAEMVSQAPCSQQQCSWRCLVTETGHSKP